MSALLPSSEVVKRRKVGAVLPRVFVHKFPPITCLLPARVTWGWKMRMPCPFVRNSVALVD